MAEILTKPFVILDCDFKRDTCGDVAHQVVAAAVAGPQATMIPSPAADMWSLGVLGFEMMSGQPLFGTQYSNNDVVAMLLG